jgi:hypothetical protein
MAVARPGLPLETPDYGPDVWRGHQQRSDIAALPSGHAKLDRHLPGRGWPLGALTELLTENPGAGEFSLLLPALAAITAQGRWLMLLDPPWVPYPPAMHGHGVALERVMLIRTRSSEESLWACEQALRGVRGGAVLAWHDDPGFARLRRLQLAAKAGCKAAFLFRPVETTHQSSPAALRLQVKAHEADISVSILKCRGTRTREAISIRRPQALPGYAALCGPVPAGKACTPTPVPASLTEVHADQHTH